MTAPISFSGLATGIDTESIIQAMLETQRQPIERLENKSEILAIQREALRDVNNQLLNLQNEALTLSLESTFSSRTASSSDESKLLATATFSAVKTTHRVNITQLAQEATVSSHRYLSQARVLGTNTVGINVLGGATRTNAPGAGRIKGGVALEATDTLGSLGLAGDFTLRIDPDGSGSHSAVEITGLDASATISQLIEKITTQVDSVKAHLIYDEALGGKALQFSSDFVGIDISTSGAVAEAVFGIDPGATVNSASSAGLGSARAYAAVNPEDLALGTYTIISSDGKAGSLTGTVDLAAAAGGGNILDLTLDDLGVTEFSNFEIDPDASGATAGVAVRKEDGTNLSATDTVGELIEAINLSVPDVTAQLVEGSGGATYLRIIANKGGREITVSQPGSTDGIMQKVLGAGSDIITSGNATGDSGDFTMVQTFYRRGNISPESRRVVSGTEEDYRTYGVADLIDGVTIVGASLGDVFTPGAARLQVNCSNSMAIGNSARTQMYGVIGVTDSSYATGLALDADSSGVIGLNKTINELNTSGAFALDDGAGITAGAFRVGNTTLSITQDEIDNGITLAEILARINSASEGMVVSYEAGTDRFVATASNYGSEETISFSNYTGAAGTSNILKVLGLTNAPSGTLTSAGTGPGIIDEEAELVQAGFSIKPTSGTFSINGISIEVDVTADSLYDIIEKINSSAAGVTASLDSVSKQISLIQNVDEDTTADFINVGSKSDTSNLLKVLRITSGANGDGSIADVESPKSRTTVGSQRKTAELTVDNIQYSRNTNTIDDITPGVTYELLGVTDSMVTVTIGGDIDRAVESIARFVTEYNKTIKLLNPERIDTSERKYLDPVTDEERSTLTYDELIERLEKFETYNKSETIRRDSNLMILQTQLRSSIFHRVDIAGSSLTSIADLGISSGEPGSPLTQNYEGVLVADSVEYEEILEALQNNQQLIDALNNDDRSVYRLFSQSALSNVKVIGTSAFDDTTPLANDIIFQVYNGSKNALITLPAGISDKTDILSIIMDSLSRAGIDDTEVSFDATGHLVFESETTSGRAFVRILDATGESATDRLSSRFGIAGGSFLGQEAESRAGVAEKLTRQLRDATGISGYISQRVSYGGTYGQGTIFDEIVQVQDQILRIEERIEQREKSLRKKFTHMEQAIARLQEQQNTLNQYFQIVSATRTAFSSSQE